MSKVKQEFENDGKAPDEAEKLSDDKWTHVAQPPLFEHGSIWHREPYGNSFRGRHNVVPRPRHVCNRGSGENVDVLMALDFNPDLDLRCTICSAI